jgi:predicted nucleic acid-binding protein
VTQPDAFLDTNVLLRHLLQDHLDHSPRATALNAAIERGERTVRTTDTVVFETAFTLEKTYRVPRIEIRDNLQPILDLSGIVLPGKRIFVEVFSLYVDHSGLSFADCYHAALTRRLRLGSIISFDQRLGRVPGITRVEPS